MKDVFKLIPVSKQYHYIVKAGKIQSNVQYIGNIIQYIVKQRNVTISISLSKFASFFKEILDHSNT